MLSHPASPPQPPVSVNGKREASGRLHASQSMEVFVRVSVFLATLVLPVYLFFALLSSPLVEGALRPSITDHGTSWLSLTILMEFTVTLSSFWSSAMSLCTAFQIHLMCFCPGLQHCSFTVCCLTFNYHYCRQRRVHIFGFCFVFCLFLIL